MSVNRARPHIYVLTEDDANRQLANAFCLVIGLDQRQIYVPKPQKGWTSVRDEFKNAYVKKMQNNRNTHVVLLIDFDRDGGRRSKVEQDIPKDLRDRVMVIGVFSNPEELKRARGKDFESIGKTLGDECREKTRNLWNDKLLRHNGDELDRVGGKLCSILFPQ